MIVFLTRRIPDQNSPPTTHVETKVGTSFSLGLMLNKDNAQWSVVVALLLTVIMSTTITGAEWSSWLDRKASLSSALPWFPILDRPFSSSDYFNFFLPLRPQVKTHQPNVIAHQVESRIVLDKPCQVATASRSSASKLHEVSLHC